MVAASSILMVTCHIHYLLTATNKRCVGSLFPVFHSQRLCCLQRLNAQHKILRDLLGSHFIGPVAEALAHQQGRQKRVLDLCTGTGRWCMISPDLTFNPSNPCILDSFDRVMDMASRFRHVRFSGVDIGTYMIHYLFSASSTLFLARSRGLTLSPYSSNCNKAPSFQRPF